MTTATMRKVTPTAVQILKADADRDEWLAARRNGIGSSDIAKIVGVADRGQAVHVWHDKRGSFLEMEDAAGEAALWGTLNEPTVASEWCRRNASVIRRIGLVAHAEHLWMMCTLDRQVRECPLDRDTKGMCGLEVKTRSAFKSARWLKAIPDDVYAQTIWQLMVTGYDHMHVAALIGGNDYRQAVVRHDIEVEQYLAGEAGKFWHRNIRLGIEPAWNYEQAEDLLDLDRRLHGTERVGEIGLDGLDDVMAYAEASAAESAAKKLRKAAQARLHNLAGGHRFVKFANELAYQVAPRSKANTDYQLLAEKYPAAYAECVSDTHYTAIQIDKAYRRSA